MQIMSETTQLPNLSQIPFHDRSVRGKHHVLDITQLCSHPENDGSYKISVLVGIREEDIYSMLDESGLQLGQKFSITYDPDNKRRLEMSVNSAYLNLFHEGVFDDDVSEKLELLDPKLANWGFDKGDWKSDPNKSRKYYHLAGEGNPLLFTDGGLFLKINLIQTVRDTLGLLPGEVEYSVIRKVYN